MSKSTTLHIVPSLMRIHIVRKVDSATHWIVILSTAVKLLQKLENMLVSNSL